MEGVWLDTIEIALEKNVEAGLEYGTIDGQRMNCVICCRRGTFFRTSSEEDSSSSLGEGGLTTSVGPCGGVGGYEWIEEVPSTTPVAGSFVRERNVKPPSTQYGDWVGMGTRGINVPAGNAGARTRIYQPRLGR